MPEKVTRLQNTSTVELSPATSREFELFYKEQYPFAYGYLNRVLRNADDAYDVLIHSFELALARFDEYLTNQKPRYWFFGIIRNSASYSISKKAREAKQEVPIPGTAPTPEDLALRNEEERLIDQVLRALPEKYRDVALLRFQDYSYKEIAKALGLSVEAVESRMRRATVKLEPIYAKYKEGRP